MWQAVRRGMATLASSEVRIPVPWGHIAGKWWGPADVRPVLAVHGWQDNSGSFDGLIPLLPAHLSYLAIDLPGHGRSSPLPAGVFYHQLNTVMHIRRLQAHFGWPQVSLLGHSLGAIACFQFAGFFAPAVDLLACLDGLTALLNPKGIASVPASIDDFLRYDRQRAAAEEAPAHTFAHLEDAMYVAQRRSVDRDKCRCILARNVAASRAHPGRFVYRRDARLKTGPLVNWPLADVLAHARQVSAPTFASRAAETRCAWKEPVYEQVRQLLAAGNPRFEMHHVPGRHHGHLNHPHVYEAILGRFLRAHAGDAAARPMDPRHLDAIRAHDADQAPASAASA